MREDDFWCPGVYLYGRPICTLHRQPRPQKASRPADTLTPLQSQCSKVRLVFKERLHITSDEIATADKL